MNAKRGLFDKEVMEKDVLNRILWDKSLDPKEFDIYYLDRFKSTLSKLNYSDARVDGDFLVHGDSVIPLHRIRSITWKGETVWQKRRV